MVYTDNFYLAIGLGVVALVIAVTLGFLLTRTKENKFDRVKRVVVAAGPAPKMEVKRAPVLKKRSS